MMAEPGTLVGMLPDPERPDEQPLGQNVNEPSICEVADGRLLITLRSIAGG